MIDTTENLQHRRQQIQHRPAYLAPSAGHIQVQQQYYHRRHHHHHYLKYHQYDRVDNDYSTESDYYDHYDDDDYDIIEDLRIPLFIKVPYDEKLRFPIISPPSSEGSTATAELVSRGGIPFYSPFIIPSLPQSEHHYHRQPTSSSQSLSSSIQQNQQQQYTLSSSSPGPGPILSFKQQIYKMISSIYYVVIDLLLLIFVCLMGLFFHVEVQVVKHGNHGRNDINNNDRGRIIIQHQQQQQQQNQNNSINDSNKNNDTQYHHQQGYHQYNRDYYRDHNHLTDLLLQQPKSISRSTPSRSIDTTADDNTYSNPYLMLLGDEMV